MKYFTQAAAITTPESVTIGGNLNFSVAQSQGVE